MSKKIPDFGKRGIGPRGECGSLPNSCELHLLNYPHTEKNLAPNWKSPPGPSAVRAGNPQQDVFVVPRNLGGVVELGQYGFFKGMASSLELRLPKQ